MNTTHLTSTTSFTSALLHRLALLAIVLLAIISQDALALTKPTLQEPSNNIEITTPSIKFSWTHPYNDKYELKIKTSGGTLKYQSGKISQKSQTVNLSNIPLSYGSAYKWYVVVYANGQDTSSEDRSFVYKNDNTKPVVSAFTATPSTVSVGKSLAVSYTVSDAGGSELRQVELWRAKDSGGTPVGWTSIATRTLSGNGPTSGLFSVVPSDTGVYWFGIHVVDVAGNWATESAPRKIVVETADDHGNDCNSATGLSLNNSRAGLIEKSGDIDYFRIEVNSVGMFTAYTTGSTNTYGTLKNASCQDIAGASNDNYNSDANFRILKSVTPGTYFVAVKHASSSGTGSYVLSVTLTAIPIANRFTWPVDPTNPTNGHAGSCNDSSPCWWISDAGPEDVTKVWRDSQRFQRANHLGADYNLGSGDDELRQSKDVYPTATGIVTEVLENISGWGNIVFVLHNTSWGIYTSMYAHVNWDPSVGKPVKNVTVVSSQVPIAKIGKGVWTQNASCPANSVQISYNSTTQFYTCGYPAHLHFELRKGDQIDRGVAYVRCTGSDDSNNTCPQKQVDPNAFIAAHN